MRAEDGDFYVGGGAAGGGDGDGASAPPPPAWTVKGADDGSFHSPAWQEQYLKSLTEIKRPSYEEFRAAEKAKEGVLAAAAETTEIETKKFRLQLEADREMRLAGGRNQKLGVKKGKVGKKGKKEKKEKKDKAGKKSSKKKNSKEGKDGKKSSKKSSKKASKKASTRSSDSSSSESGSSSEEEEAGGDPTEKYRLSGFFNKE